MISNWSPDWITLQNAQNLVGEFSPAIDNALEHNTVLVRDTEGVRAYVDRMQHLMENKERRFLIS